jgi:hypothetical protein
LLKWLKILLLLILYRTLVTTYYCINAVLGAIIRIILPESHENLDILSMKITPKKFMPANVISTGDAQKLGDCKLDDPDRLKVGRYQSLLGSMVMGVYGFS